MSTLKIVRDELHASDAVRVIIGAVFLIGVMLRDAGLI